MLQLKVINKRERYGFTWLGWIVFLSAIIISLTICLRLLHPFLATNAPVNGDIMVVEGWLPDYALEKVIVDFQDGYYKSLVITGGPLSKGSYFAEYSTYAELTAATLIKIGFDDNKLFVIPTPAVNRDRTYASAIALKKWLDNSGIVIEALDIYSFGPHSRRSWLLFQYVFTPDIAIGIVAIEDRSYNAKKWWKTSSGVRIVLSETIAYIYAKFFFIPW